MSESQEDQIQRVGATTAPRVTPEHIAATIAGESYHRLTDTLTICVLTLVNGFTVTGESACASPANYNEEVGNRIARENAVGKIWLLEGYLLKQRLHAASFADMDREMRDPPFLAIIDVAAICHEANATYCNVRGDLSQPSWLTAPAWQQESAIAGVRFHLEHPNATAAASHESWLEQKRADGWRYGPEKDPDAKEHPCFVPFAELPAEQQAKDHLFRGIVHALRPFIIA